MDVHSNVALVPVSFASSTRGEGQSGRGFPFPDREDPRNGVVFVGHERNRVRSLYASSGKPAGEIPRPGKIIDITV
jgi:hypothetical protein